MKNTKQCSFRCSEETWKRFKLACLVKNVSCQDKLSELIEEFVPTNIHSSSGKENGKKFKNNIQRVSAS